MVKNQSQVNKFKKKTKKSPLEQETQRQGWGHSNLNSEKISHFSGTFTQKDFKKKILQITISDGKQNARQQKLYQSYKS